MKILAKINLKKMKVQQACAVYGLTVDQVKRLRADQDVIVREDIGQKLFNNNCAEMVATPEPAEYEEPE